MTLPAAYNPISISNITTEIGLAYTPLGTPPVMPTNLGAYYKGGSHVREGIYNPYGIPTSGPISLHNFHNAQTPYWYNVRRTYAQWQASASWCVEYFANRLSVVLASVSSAYHTYGTSESLIYATASTLAAAGGGGWSQVCRVNLTTPGTIYYGTNATLLQNGGIFGNETINYWFPSGWCMAARYNGGNSVTIFQNQEGNNSTNDTGSNITLSNLPTAFAYFSGYSSVPSTDKNGQPTTITVPNSSFTYDFR